ncbi:hypothetical protein AMATHDRAFT_62642 [Amanita thiersii Skay4041]|uniref:Uncharacterized protein n=1 Tax=Amanita thiersii Skay4041 TaxID=703135 RepID=A0A2A9NF89_9AGAR|nr:hypothetical protein AMATHDRAFT_62642 [Amanita thiersii Skay4041]
MPVWSQSAEAVYIQRRLSVPMAERPGPALGEFGWLYGTVNPSEESDVAALRDPPLETSEED